MSALFAILPTPFRYITSSDLYKPPLNRSSPHTGSQGGEGHFLWEGGHFLSGAVQGCAAGLGILFMPEII